MVVLMVTTGVMWRWCCFAPLAGSFGSWLAILERRAGVPNCSWYLILCLKIHLHCLWLLRSVPPAASVLPNPLLPNCFDSAGAVDCWAYCNFGSYFRYEFSEIGRVWPPPADSFKHSTLCLGWWVFRATGRGWVLLAIKCWVGSNCYWTGWNAMLGLLHLKYDNLSSLQCLDSDPVGCHFYVEVSNCIALTRLRSGMQCLLIGSLSLFSEPGLK